MKAILSSRPAWQPSRSVSRRRYCPPISRGWARKSALSRPRGPTTSMSMSWTAISCPTSRSGRSSCSGCLRSLQAIRAEGKKAGVALNPATPVSALVHVIDNVDLILVMSVNPGFGGQNFIPEAVTKLRQAKALIGARKIDLEVDGGINPETAALVARAGANVLVAGNAVFSGNDPKTYAPRIKAMRT